MDEQEHEWLKVPEVAKTLRIARSRAYELVADGEIPAVRIGRSVRVSRILLGEPSGGGAHGQGDTPPCGGSCPAWCPRAWPSSPANPSLGKSWLALGLCVAVASGGVAFGNVRVEKGSALYLALEDNERRLQFRLKKILAGTEAPDGLHYSVERPRPDEGGVEAVEGWLRSRPDARLVVIDTLAKIRPRQRRGANAYQEDYEALEALLPLAARHNVAVLVVHHLRKMAASDPLDEVNSSIGLTGGVEKK